MSFCTNELYTSVEHPDGYDYKVTIENSMKGLARLVVECMPTDSDEAVNSQGVDLTLEECKSLAHMLLAVADLIERDIDEKNSGKAKAVRRRKKR